MKLKLSPLFCVIVHLIDWCKYRPDTRLWCKLCYSPSNDIRSFQDHNHGVKHREKLLEFDLPDNHGDYEFHEDYIMTPFYSSEYYGMFLSLLLYFKMYMRLLDTNEDL